MSLLIGSFILWSRLLLPVTTLIIQPLLGSLQLWHDDSLV